MTALPVLLEDETLSTPLPIDVSEFEGTQINPASFLATDYLNHFNEVIMLIEMLPDMPDCVADVLEWQPVSYTEHFAKSGFKHADLTIRAYHAAPKAVRNAFDSLIADITVSVIEIIKQVEIAVELGDMNALRLIVMSQVRDLRGMIDEASGIINGVERVQTMNQDFFEDCSAKAKAKSEQTSAKIDAIFNAV